MKYEDLKDTFTFKTQEGKSSLTYTADKKSKHVWSISNDDTDMSVDWDCEDMLGRLNNGAWVIQDEEETEQVLVVQEQVEQTQEVKTLRDEFAMAALTGWLASSPLIKGRSIRGTEEDAESMASSAYVYADAMLQARKEGRVRLTSKGEVKE